METLANRLALWTGLFTFACLGVMACGMELLGRHWEAGMMLGANAVCVILMMWFTVEHRLQKGWWPWQDKPED